MMRLMHPSERHHPCDVPGCDRLAAWTLEHQHYCHDHWSSDPWGPGGKFIDDGTGLRPVEPSPDN